MLITRFPLRQLRATVVMLAVLLCLLGAPSVAAADSENIATLAARACAGEGYLDYVGSDAAAFRNTGECVRSARATGMLLVRSIYATGEFNGLQCFFVYDEITERLVYLGGSNNSALSGATSTCYVYTLSPFELLARTEPMGVGETALVSVLHLGIVDGLYRSEEAGDFLPVLFGVFSACCGG